MQTKLLVHSITAIITSITIISTITNSFIPAEIPSETSIWSYLEKISLSSCSATFGPRFAMKSVEQGGLWGAAGC